MKLKPETISKLRYEYFYYLIPIFIMNFIIPIFYLGIDFYLKKYFDINEFLGQVLIQTSTHFIYLFAIIIIYYYAEKKYFSTLNLNQFCKIITTTVVKITGFFQILQTTIIILFALGEIAKDNLYKGKIAIYFIVGVSVVYQYIIITMFLTYMATQIVERKFKTRIFEETKILFKHGNEKIKTEILVSFFVIGIVPLLILLLFQIHGTEGNFFKGDRIYIIGTFIVVFTGIAACLVFQKELISFPIETLVSAMDQVEQGNFKVRVPISKSNELSLLSSKFNDMLDGLEEKEKIKDEFGKYLSPEVAKEILNSKKNIWEGEEKEITILFTDIEGFTTLSEKLEAKEIVKLLNEYFTELVNIIKKNSGVVNKFIGDSILAIYNAPLNDINHAENAFQTALEISKLNENKKFSSDLIIKTRIGINTGKVIIGNLGSKERLEYTVIGDAVNVAQRLESMNKELSTTILISESTKNLIQEKIQFQIEKEIFVKGRKESIHVFGI